MGSLAGASMAVQITAPFLAPLLVLGFPGAVAAGILSFGIGVVGAIAGESAALYLLEKGKELMLFAGDALEDFADAVQDTWEDVLSGVGGIADLLNNGYDRFSDAVADSVRRIDPLIIDMGGDGLELDSWQNSGVQFDLDGNGTKENSRWIRSVASGGDEAFLAIDKNNNGNIDNIDELFGNATTTGFAELKKYDSNNDNLINATHTQFNLLELWNSSNKIVPFLRSNYNITHGSTIYG